MLRHNSKKRYEALEELRDIVSESLNGKESSRSRLRVFNWTTKYLPPGEWSSTKSFWRKIL